MDSAQPSDLRHGGYEITEEFYDTAVSGADPIETRPGFAAMLERIEGTVSAPSSSACGFCHQRCLLWDATSGNALAMLAGYTRAVTSAAFSPDGTRVVTASEDLPLFRNLVQDELPPNECALLGHAQRPPNGRGQVAVRRAFDLAGSFPARWTAANTG